MKNFPFAKIRDFLSDYDENYDYINWGGCAVSAVLLAEALTSFVDELKIVVYDDNCSNPQKVNINEMRNYISRNTLPEWNELGIYFGHVWVEFKWKGRWYAIDSDGLKSRKEMYERWGVPLSGALSFKEMKELADSSRGWNSMFDRKQIPSMKKFVKKNLVPILEVA